MSMRDKDRGLLVVGTAIVLFVAGAALCITLARWGHTEHAMLGGVFILASAALAVLRLMPTSRPQADATPARLDEIADSVREIAAHNAMSPEARRVLFRSQERQILTQAIETEIARREWNAASMLAQELEDRLGYVEQAGLMRETIREARERPPLTAPPIAPSMFPPVAAPIPVEQDEAVGSQRRARREELELMFTRASERGESNEALAILKELDQYLTPEEAEPLREAARSIIAKARDAMGERFKAAVQDKRWGEAVRTGEQIMSEFPNTRMASEVRDVLDALRAKADRGTGSPATA